MYVIACRHVDSATGLPDLACQGVKLQSVDGSAPLRVASGKSHFVGDQGKVYPGMPATIASDREIHGPLTSANALADELLRNQRGARGR